ncbi:thioesterase family protein [Saliniramus sp.]|uniref:thioesterase family protein n=1 Tax=Saliniramus sp. TaxID=2986772 RepID=UPI002C4105AB|nr:thioesterase [Saliniramus sp.]HMB09653.1 thioesterase [Saliniramus sp.]
MPELKANLTGSLTYKVSAGDLATAWRNDVPVLATPVLLWLSELASMRAIADTLPEGEMTVGLSHDSAHLAPTPEGWSVQISASLTQIEGRKLVFAVEASDGRDVILKGTHVRAIVNRERFVGNLAAKADLSAVGG